MIGVTEVTLSARVETEYVVLLKFIEEIEWFIPKFSCFVLIKFVKLKAKFELKVLNANITPELIPVFAWK